MEVANNIGMLAESFEMKLEVVWKRRNTDEIEVCDKLSKEFDLSKHRVERYDFIGLDGEFLALKGALCRFLHFTCVAKR